MKFWLFSTGENVMDMRDRLAITVGFMASSYWADLLDVEDRTRKIGLAVQLAHDLSDTEVERIKGKLRSLSALDIIKWVDNKNDIPRPKWFDTEQNQPA